MKLKIKKLTETAVIPSYAKPGDACFDLTAVSVNTVNDYIEYGTGLAMEIPEGHVGLIFPRSSVTNKDLMLKNSVGVIDSSYRGMISFRFNNVSSDERTAEIYTIGDRVGQMMILPVPMVQFEEVDELSSTERGEGGYGSSGH
jgi:dUTP pyrophosphatase